MEWEWIGNPEASLMGRCNGYIVRLKAIGNGWYCHVWFKSKKVFDSEDAGILPQTGDAARRLCELVVRVELGRAGHG